MSKSWFWPILAIPVLLPCADPEVQDREGGLWGDSLTLVEEVRIGGLEGESYNSFGRVTAVAEASNGRIYIADAQVPAIYSYDSLGHYLGTVGKGGEGPGEYQSVGGLGVNGEGSLIVWDSRGQRLSWYSSDGTFQESRQVEGGLGGWRQFVVAENDGALLKLVPREGLVETADGIRADWSLVDRDSVKRLWADPQFNATGPSYVLAGRGGYYRPFTVATLSAVGPDGSLYVMRNDSYRIRRLSLSGDTLEFGRDLDPIPVGPEEKQQWEAISENFAERLPEQRGRFFPIPDEKPYARELVVDLEERVWVSRHTEPVHVPYPVEEAEQRRRDGRPIFEWRTRLSWDVFSAAGTYLGTVTLPANTSLVQAKGEKIWGIQAGEFGEDYVVRWRFEPAGGLN